MAELDHRSLPALEEREGEAIAIANQAERYGVKFMVGHVSRFEADHAHARKVVERGDLGQLRMASQSITGAFPEWGTDGWFADVAQTTGVGRSPKSGMNASIGDVFNDGRLAIYKTNISEPGQLVQGNDLWVPEARGTGRAEFQNMATTLGVDLGGWSWGAQFGDLNNDGSQDLYLVNGYVSAGERSSYWYDFSVIAVGHSSIIADAANWPPMKGRSLSGYQRKRVCGCRTALHRCQSSHCRCDPSPTTHHPILA